MDHICLITFRPKKSWCKFLNTFTKYKIVIIVDDNDFDLSLFKYENIKFIKIKDEICKQNGYENTNFFIKPISGWDKALYYFGLENSNYNFVWFLEDDVFFYNENTLLTIDKEYKKDDLLSNNFNINQNGVKNTWHWNKININYTPPYYHGMMCIVRFSKKMMFCINDYAKKNNTLFFLEAMFPTIAIKNKLKYNNPTQFNDVHYRHKFTKKKYKKKKSIPSY